MTMVLVVGLRKAKPFGEVDRIVPKRVRLLRRLREQNALANQ